MNIGKQLRMRRLFNKGKTVIITMDHAHYFGPLRGIEDISALVKMVSETEVDGILISPWLLESVRDVLGNLAVIVRLDAGGTNWRGDTTLHEPVASIEYALQTGADMGILNICMGTENEHKLLHNLGRTATKCSQWGFPLMAEMLPASTLNYHFIGDEKDTKGKPGRETISVKEIKLVSRIGAELGADIIKTHYTGTQEGFKEVLASCPVPIVCAGGPKTQTEKEYFQMVRDMVTSGASGITMGRNIWQHKNPKGMMNALCALVHDKAEVDNALSLIEKG